MKKIFVWCLIVMFGVLSVNLIGCNNKPEKPKEPAMTEPVIQPPTAPEPTPPVAVEKPKPETPKPKPKPVPIILSVTEKGGVWSIKLSKLAKAVLQKNADMTVRLNVGYMIYESKSMNGDVIEIKPEWHPSGRVTAGLWRAGPFGTGKYISSMEVSKNIAKKPFVIFEEIKKSNEIGDVKDWIKGNIGGDPPPWRGGGGGATRGNRPNLEPTVPEKKSELTQSKTLAQADVLTSDELKKPKPEEPKLFQPKTVVLYDATTGNSVNRMKEVWK